MVTDNQNLRFHPYNILLTLLLAGITVLFLAFSGAYIYSRVQNPDIPPIRIPTIFIFNTLVLISSSLTLIQARKAYLDDRTEKYRRSLIATLALTILFLILQYIGWKQLLSQDIAINHSTTASYLYLISGLHFAHVIAGLPFLILFIRAAYLHMKEPLSVMLYFSDPAKKLKLRLLTIYWHFLDILWIYLVVFFVVNRMI